MIARIDARVAEGKAGHFFSDLSLHQCAHRARCGMKISARNRLKDRIVDVKEGASPANVKIKVGGGIIRMRFTVEQLKLARGKTAYAVRSDIMLDRRMLLTGANVDVVVLDIQHSCHEEISGTF